MTKEEKVEKTEPTKLNLLEMLKYLWETDEENPLTVDKIQEKLSVYNNYADTISDKLVKRNIKALQQNGYDIVDDNGRFYFASRQFEDWELKVLCDAVAGAKFLADSDSQALLKKLGTLTSEQGRKTLELTTPQQAVVKGASFKVKYHIANILKAIKTYKKVAFQYMYTDTELKRKARKDGYQYLINPYSLIWRHDCYYLIGNTEPHEGLSCYRLDRIDDLKIVEDSNLKTIEKCLGDDGRFQLKEYIKKSIYNYTGKKVNLTLQFKADLVDDLLDFFGRELHIRPCGDEYEVTVVTTESDGLYYWLLQYGEHIIVKGSKEVRDEYLRRLQLIAAKYQ